MVYSLFHKHAVVERVEGAKVRATMNYLISISLYYWLRMGVVALRRTCEHTYRGCLVGNWENLLYRSLESHLLRGEMPWCVGIFLIGERE